MLCAGLHRFFVILDCFDCLNDIKIFLKIGRTIGQVVLGSHRNGVTCHGRCSRHWHFFRPIGQAGRPQGFEELGWWGETGFFDQSVEVFPWIYPMRSVLPWSPVGGQVDHEIICRVGGSFNLFEKVQQGMLRWLVPSFKPEAAFQASNPSRIPSGFQGFD